MTPTVAEPRSKIPRISWAHTAFVTIGSTTALAGTDAGEYTAAAVCLASFFAGFCIWVVAFAKALGRTTRGDDVAVANWVFLSGSAPDGVRRQLLGAALVVLVMTLIVTTATPFVWLANLAPLGFAALWGAEHGTFPPRKVARGGARGGSSG